MEASLDKSVFCVLAFKEQKRKKVCILFASSRKCKNILKIIRESPGKAGEFIGIVRIIKIIIYKFIWIKKIKEKIQKSVDKTRVILYNKPIKKKKEKEGKSQCTVNWNASSKSKQRRYGPPNT